MRSIRRLGIYFIITTLLLGLVPNTALANSTTTSNDTTLRQGSASATAIRAINVRSGPDRNFWVVDVLEANETVPVLGISPDGGWWLVQTSFARGWVADTVVTTSNTISVPVRNPGASVAVTTGELTVRSGPGLAAPVLGIARTGNRLYFLGRNGDGTWINVRTQFGTGWVATEFTTIAGSPVAPVTAEQAIAIVQAATLNVRTGPGVEFQVLGVVDGGTELTIIGTNSNRTWFNVQTPFGPGWVSDLYVITRNEFGGSPNTTDTVNPATVLGATAIINAYELNVRSGPAATFTIVDTVSGGEQYQILARNASFTWLLIDNGQFDGWVNVIYVVIRGNTSNLPVVDATTAATVIDPDTGDTAMVSPVVTGPVAVVATGALNIRRGPNVAFEPFGFVYAGTRLPIVGQSPDGNWWQVESTFGLGWVNKRLVRVENSTLNVPVVQ